MLAELIGDSAGIRAAREQLARLVQRGAHASRLPPLLFLGETGTGKGLAARAVHRAGPRRRGPFLAVNCAAIPETLLEGELFGVARGAFTDAREARPGLVRAAHGGTLFLDEIGALPLPLQAKLLTTLDTREVRPLGGARGEPVDVWLMAATNEDLPAALRAGRFREDLYHRLATVTVRFPPLRERGADVLALAEHYLARACGDYGLPAKTLDPDARAALLAYAWPGNVRELANVIERAALLTDARRISALDLALPGDPGRDLAPAPSRPLGETVAEVERGQLRAALEATGWNLSRAAARLGLPRNTLRHRIAKLGLARSAPASPPPPAAGRAAAGEAGSPAPEPRLVVLLGLTREPPDAHAGLSHERWPLDGLVAKATAFGGEVLEREPTGFVAAFGLQPDEEAPSRAAHAALALQLAARRAIREDPARPPVRVAVHAATLPAARVLPRGHPARLELDRLLAAAEPGTTLISDAIAPHLERRFTLAPADRPLEEAGGA